MRDWLQGILRDAGIGVLADEPAFVLAEPKRIELESTRALIALAVVSDPSSKIR